MTKEAKQQFAARIAEANRTGLVVILYEMNQCYLQDAMQAMKEGNDEELNIFLARSRGCINELMQSLHMEYELARNMMQLYVYCLKRMVAAQNKKDIAALEQVYSIMQRLLDSYREAVKDDRSEPEMQNTQQVYTGLTYGRDGSPSNTCFFKESR